MPAATGSEKTGLTERIVARPVSAWVRVRARGRVRDRGKVRVRDRGKVRGSGRGRGERLPAHNSLELVQYHVEHLVEDQPVVSVVMVESPDELLPRVRAQLAHEREAPHRLEGVLAQLQAALVLELRPDARLDLVKRGSARTYVRKLVRK